MRVLRISHSAVVGSWRERERELIRRGIDVRLLSAKAWNEGGGPVPLEPGADDFVTGVRTIGTHPNVFLYAPGSLWRALREGWDIIDIHEEPCSLATAEILLLRWLARVRTPFVLYSAQNIDKRYPIPFRWLERHALRRASGVSVCNHAAGEILNGKGLAGAAVDIPLGVDLDAFRPVDRNPPDPPSLRVGYVGRLEEHKGVDVAIDAVGGVPGARLDIVGAGPIEDDLREQVRAGGLTERITFRGGVAADRLAVAYREFDVLVVPSQPRSNWLEQFGRVVVEAMATGVPVIASRSGALPDVVGDAGVLVEPGDVPAWTRALAEVGSDPERWAGLRAAGLRRAGRYSWAAVADGMQHLYSIARGLPPEAGAGGDPGLDVVVVAYGAPDKLDTALAALGGEFPILVVDNSSSAETAAVVERHGGRYLDPGANLGFAAGVNHALEHRIDPHRDVLLLNPDAVVRPVGVRALHAALRADAGLAAVAPEQVDLDGQPGRVEWPFPTPGRAWLEAAGLGKLDTGDTFLIGAVLVLRAEAVLDVGPFDERFFLYAEEVDWQRRARRAGWRFRFVTGVSAVHEGAGAGADPAWRTVQFTASHELYLRKHFGTVGWSTYRAGAFVGASVRSAVLPGRDRRAAARRRAWIYLRGPVRLNEQSTRPGVSS